MRTKVLTVFAILLFACNSAFCASSASSALQQEHFSDKEVRTQKNQLLSFGLLKQDNASWLLKDYIAEINGDTIKIFIPYLSHFSLKPQFSVDKKAKVYVNGSKLISGSSEVNFSKPVQLTVVAGGKKHIYTIMVYNSGLPIVYINTKNGQPIKSKSKWLDSTQMIVYMPDGTVDYDSGTPMAQIKGRGNSTWNVKRKCPYALKLNVSGKILGMPENKHWSLLANFFDETLLKNDFALHLGQQYTNMEWVPHGQHVELVLNNEHLGNYYLCEQVRIGKNRVRGKYLVEIEQRERAGRPSVISLLGCKMKIVDTDRKNGKVINEDDISSVRMIVNQFETELKKISSGNVLNYKNFIDIESFADWYLIKEISNDVDGGFKTSSFFYIDADDKIKMGPIWDFDRSFDRKPIDNNRNIRGVHDADYEGYNVGKAIWYSLLLQDPDFVKILIQKLDVMIADSASICNYIDINAERLSLSASENNFIYNTKQNTSKNGVKNHKTAVANDADFEYVKSFAIKRMVWLKSDLEKRQRNGNYNIIFDNKKDKKRLK